MEKPVERISVRNLVEFIKRSGDLDDRKGSMDKEAMQKGSRLHRKIQREMGSTYRAEVSLKRENIFEDVTILLEGRADGVFEEDGRIWIDEIKGTYANIRKMEGPAEVHRAQAMCYGWIVMEKENLEEIGIQMTYGSLDTEEIRRFREVLNRQQLEKWYRELLDEYHRWISFSLSWKKERNASMQGLEFPFPYRQGQKKMVGSIYHTISEKKQIFIQAPTGIGKTMSSIFPAVRAAGEGKGGPVFYLTAKTITRTVAQEAYEILRQKGLKFKNLTITAKEKLCIMEKCSCNPQDCPRAKGHFDRINEAVYELWTTEDSYTREVIGRQAEKWQVCPFELCLDLAVWMDGIICDYNYVFDPNVKLKRFFGEGVTGNYIFLIDEAHNLAERGREMYSASVTRGEIKKVRKLMKKQRPALGRALGRADKQLAALEAECDGNVRVLDHTGTFSLALLQVSGELEKLLEEPPEEGIPEEVLEFYFHVRDFLFVDELLDDNYVIYTEKETAGDFRLKLFCVNPASNLQQCMEKGVGTAFFSATLLPMDYYRKLLSTRSDDYGIYVPSPFPAKNRCILSARDVSSRYTRRNDDEYRRIAGYIARVVWQKKGNYMVFFPSYKLMEDVVRIYEEEFSASWVRCIRQNAGMDEKEREEFLEEFRESAETLVGFCVMGGIFSEGIDLTGQRLIGAIIVGTGLPQVSNERELLKDYYDKREGKGFDYAYRFPGMNKVLQAAGRVIRTAEDIGVIVLLDDRFSEAAYSRLFPVEWADRRGCRMGEAEEILKEFWDRKATVKSSGKRT